MKENKYAKVTLKDIKKLNEDLEKKLHISKVKVYGSTLLSASFLLGSVKLMQESICTYFNTIGLDKLQFGAAAVLGLAGAVFLTSDIIDYAPEFIRLHKEKRMLEAKKKELLKVRNKTESRNIYSVKGKDAEINPLKEYINFKEIEKALNIQIDKDLALLQTEKTESSSLKEYINFKKIEENLNIQIDKYLQAEKTESSPLKEYIKRKNI